MSHARPTPSEPPSRSRTLAKSHDDLHRAFFALKTRRDVAEILDIPYWQLTYLLHRSPSLGRYRHLEIKKKSGGIRRLLVPNASIAACQTKLAQVLSAVYEPKTCVTGFVKKGSVLKNAKCHVRRSWLLNVDIADFFPSINFGRVRGIFRSRPYGMTDDVATTLAQICCHDNQLPQGAPTSPVVSNMVCARLDGELIRLAKRHRLTYTRYVDDLSFSTTLPNFPTEIATIGPELSDTILGAELDGVLRRNGFTANPKKCRLQGRNNRQEVTGVIVSRFPNVRRGFVRRIRAMMHAWEKFGYEAAESEFRSRHNRRHRAPHRKNVTFKNVLRGQLGYLSMIRGKSDPLVIKLRTRYGKLDPVFEVKKGPALHEAVGAALWVLESEKESKQGTAFAAHGIGLITVDHVVYDDTHAFRTDRPNEKFPVTVLARSDAVDLAILNIANPLETALELNGKYSPSIGDQVNIAGFPNHQTGDTGHFLPQRVVSLRRASGQQRVLVDGPIAGGMSGGPVVDANARVIGIIVSGAEELSQANMTERHGFIPVEVIVSFLRDNNLPFEI